MDRVKPLRTPTAAHTSGLVNLVLSRQTVFFFSEYEHPFIDWSMVITEPNVTSTRPLGLGSKLYLTNMPRMLNKDLMQSLSWLRQNRAGSVPDPEPEIKGGEDGLQKTIISAFQAFIWSKIKGWSGRGPRAPLLDPPLRVKKGSAASVKTTERVV